jgi:DNA-binding response OmpR family regulator
MHEDIKEILKTTNLLLVEDDERIMEKFSRLLSIYVNKIYHASNGKKALALFKKHRPSFIITDIEMPIVNGLEFVEILRKQNEQIPVIVTSAYSNKEYLFSAIKLQLIDYLVKPINYNELLIALEKVALSLKKSEFLNAVKISEGIVYIPNDKTISVDGVNIILTIKETELLELLISNRGNTVTKSMIEEKLFIFKEMSDSGLKNMVYKLRKKIGKDIILSVGRLGYKIN